MIADPHALDLPEREEPTPWPGWTGVRESTSVPDRHDDSEARADR